MSDFSGAEASADALGAAAASADDAAAGGWLQLAATTAAAIAGLLLLRAPPVRRALLDAPPTPRTTTAPSGGRNGAAAGGGAAAANQHSPSDAWLHEFSRAHLAWVALQVGRSRRTRDARERTREAHASEVRGHPLDRPRPRSRHTFSFDACRRSRSACRKRRDRPHPSSAVAATVTVFLFGSWPRGVVRDLRPTPGTPARTRRVVRAPRTTRAWSGGARSGGASRGARSRLRARVLPLLTRARRASVRSARHRGLSIARADQT